MTKGVRGRLRRRRDALAAVAQQFYILPPLIVLVLFFTVWRIVEISGILTQNHCEWLEFFTHREPGAISVYWSLVAIIVLLTAVTALWFFSDFKTVGSRRDNIRTGQYLACSLFLAYSGYAYFTMYGVLEPRTPIGSFVFNRAQQVFIYIPPDYGPRENVPFFEYCVDDYRGVEFLDAANINGLCAVEAQQFEELSANDLRKREAGQLEQCYARRPWLRWRGEYLRMRAQEYDEIREENERRREEQKRQEREFFGLDG